MTSQRFARPQRSRLVGATSPYPGILRLIRVLTPLISINRQRAWAQACCHVILLSMLSLFSMWAEGGPLAHESVQIAMTEQQWQASNAKTKIEFVRLEGFPLGLLNVKSGVAALKGVTLRDGTIEFDVKTDSTGMPGIHFHQADDNTGELIYFRPGSNCPASNDCVQYAPITQGATQWDLFPQYQRAAPLNTPGWNHVKIVLSGRRMNLFVNHSLLPVLSVGRLEGDALSGGIRLQGPAIYANLSLTPNAVDGLSPVPVIDPTAKDGRYVRVWQVSPVSILPPGKQPSFADMPSALERWQPVDAERDGLINLSRLYKTPDPANLRCTAWLKTTILSDRDQTRQVAFGWIREAYVFVNGKLIVSGRNFWDPPGPKRTPDGRLSLENASFDMPLRKGANEIVVAIDNQETDSPTHYGWGLELRFFDASGLTMPRVAARSTP